MGRCLMIFIGKQGNLGNEPFKIQEGTVRENKLSNV